MIGTQQSAIYDLHYLFFAYSDFRPFPERLHYTNFIDLNLFVSILFIELSKNEMMELISADIILKYSDS